MRYFRLSWVTLVSAFAITSLGLLGQSPARAQESQDKSYDWNGFYGGGNVGGAFGGSDVLSTLGSGLPFFEGQNYFLANGVKVANSGVPGVIAAYGPSDGSFSGIFVSSVSVSVLVSVSVSVSVFNPAIFFSLFCPK